MNQEDLASRITSLLAALPPEDQASVIQSVRAQAGLRDALEIDLNTDPVHIVGALRVARGLVLRMFRGVLAEYMFSLWLEKRYPRWKNVTPDGDHPYDFALTDGYRNIKIQVKLLRSKDLGGGAVGTPLIAHEARKTLGNDMYVVETDKTRKGQKGNGNTSEKEDTRPIQFGDFDLLVVCMWPVTNEWEDFLIAPQSWLLPRTKLADAKKLFTMQPVPPKANDDWTDDLTEAVKRLDSKSVKKIRKTNAHPDLLLGI